MPSQISKQERKKQEQEKQEQEKFKNIFENDYQGADSFIDTVLEPIFGNMFTCSNEDILSNHPEMKIAAERTKVESITRIGTIEIDGDTTEVFDINIDNSVLLSRSRVNIQQIVRSLLFPYTNAFMLFHYQDCAGHQWRFSFLSKKDIQGNITTPKRYTYLFGKGEQCRTAAERFVYLANSTKTTKDMVNAFDVEKLNNDFLFEYKIIYGHFCGSLTGFYYDGDKGSNKWTKKRYKEYDTTKEAQFKSVFGGDSKAARDYIKKMMGRLVFLKFLEKKGWLGCGSSKELGKGDRNFLQNCFEHSEFKDDFLDTVLEEIFKSLNQQNYRTENSELSSFYFPYLNGGLFEQSAQDNAKLKLPEDHFKELFEMFNTFNFTIDESSPMDVEVSVDPEMLGHIFENLLEDNKDKGTYYTPKKIVQYMCQQSLIEYLKSHLIQDNDSDAIEHFVKNKEANEFIKANAKQIEQLLADVKICDPAIGSGAFPMGLLQEILALKIQLHVEQHNSIANFAVNRAKLDIIQNSIYGVDIEQGAVDIARLRFWLSLVVDEDQPLPLPNLDYKIMQGNSLLESFGDVDLSQLLQDDEMDMQASQISFDFGEEFLARQRVLVFDKASKDDIQKLINTYFDFEQNSNNDYSNKKDIKDRISNILEGKLLAKLFIEAKHIEEKIVKINIDIAINKIQPNDPAGTCRKKEAKIKLLNKDLSLLEDKLTHLYKDIDELKRIEHNGAEKPYFLWHTFFREVFDRGGFDIVIGNPPYIQLQANGGQLGKQTEGENYKTFEYTGDIYCLFYERGLQMLKDGGIETYITSNKWMRAGYGESMRKYFTEYNPIRLIDLGANVFKATVDTNILIVQKIANQDTLQAAKLTGKDKDFENITFDKIEINEGSIWTILSPIEQSIKRKIEAVGTPLKDWDISINYGIKTGYNDAFIIPSEVKDKLIAEDPKSAEIIRPILRGKDIKRYRYEFADKWLITTFPALHIDIELYPAVKKHLLTFGKRIHQTGEDNCRKKTGNKWFETQDQIGYWEDFSKQKIVYPNMTKFLPFVYDDKGFLTNQKCFIITGKNIAFLTVFFNSSIFKFCFRDNFPELQGDTRELSKVFFDKIPVIEIDDKTNIEFINILNEIQQQKQNNINTKSIELKADNMINELYNLTQKEMETIGFIEI